MTRKGAWIGLPFLLGLASAMILGVECGYILILTSVGIIVLSLAFLRKNRIYVITCCVSFSCAVGINMLYTEFVYNKLISLDNQIVIISGYVKDYNYIGSDTVNVTIKGKINGITAEISCFLDDDDYDYGEEITAKLKVSKISDSMAFESEDYYRSKGVFLTGKSVESSECSHKCIKPIFNFFCRYRDKVKYAIISSTSDRQSGFLTGMICGDKSEIPKQLKAKMYKSGIGHIFAVSGCHLIIITALFETIVGIFVKNRRLKTFLILFEIWGFALFSGFSVTVIRAAVMLTISQAGFLFERQPDCLNSLGISGLILTISNPYVVMSSSFLLSFTAVFALSYVQPKIVSKFPKDLKFRFIWDNIAASTSIILLTAPICVYFFGGISIISIISNLILVPLCTIALGITFIGALTIWIPFLPSIAFNLAAIVITPVILGVEILSEIPYSYIALSGKAAIIIVVLTSIVPFLLLKGNIQRFSMGCCCTVLIWIITSNICYFPDNYLKITVVTNDKNPAYVLSYNDSIIIFDLSGKTDLNQEIEHLLNSRGITNIDYMFIHDEPFSSIISTENDFSYAPNNYIISNTSCEIWDNVIYLSANQNARIGKFIITLDDNGYILEYLDFKIKLYKEDFTVNNTRYGITDETLPLEFSEKNMEVRRLNYDFE